MIKAIIQIKDSGVYKAGDIIDVFDDTQVLSDNILLNENWAVKRLVEVNIKDMAEFLKSDFSGLNNPNPSARRVRLDLNKLDITKDFLNITNAVVPIDYNIPQQPHIIRIL